MAIKYAILVLIVYLNHCFGEIKNLEQKCKEQAYAQAGDQGIEVPEKCKATVEYACIEGSKAYDWLVKEVCRRKFKVNYN